MLTNVKHIALVYVRQNRPSLNSMGEEMRQKVIDLGMQEPPLVDVMGEEVSVTEAGRDALKHNTLCTGDCYGAGGRSICQCGYVG